MLNSTPVTPILAKTAVSPAEEADSSGPKISSWNLFRHDLSLQLFVVVSFSTRHLPKKEPAARKRAGHDGQSSASAVTRSESRARQNFQSIS